MSHDNLRDALDELSKAHGPSQLAAAHASLQASIRRKRAKVQEKLGPLATAVKECLEIRDAMKAGGVEGDELNKGMEQVLREHWPRNRDQPWSYVCEKCQDYGAEIFNCPDVKCQRDKPHGPHSYAIPCWCAKGRRFNEKQLPTEADAMERAAKPQKPTRWGR